MKSFVDYLSRPVVLIQIGLTGGSLVAFVLVVIAVKAIEASRAVVLY